MAIPHKSGTGKRVAFAGLATILFFVLVEVGFRLVVSATSDRLVQMIDNYRVRYYSHVNQELKYRPHPYFGYTRLDRGSQDAINSLGFWGPEWAVEKPSGTVRIVALGGSTTAGPTAWPYQLEELLQREVDGVDVEVLNLGIGGWTSAEAVAAFAMVGLSFSPDLVVVHCVNNDMEPMRAMQPKVDYSHYRRAMNVVQTEAGAARFRQDAGDIVDAVIAKWSKLYVYAKLFQSGQVPPRASLHALTTWNNDTQPEPGARGVAIFERNLRSIAALASANGAQTVLATMPALSTKVPGIPMVPDGHLRSLEAQNQRLRNLAEAEGWILADLALLSETLTPHYEDAIHVTMDGERIKAQGVVDALTEARVFGLGQPGSVTPDEASP